MTWSIIIKCPCCKEDVVIEFDDKECSDWSVYTLYEKRVRDALKVLKGK